MSPQTILHFWFTELSPKQQFAKDAVLDEAIRTRFGATLEAAARCITEPAPQRYSGALFDH